jgi:hypothetical protein
MTWEELKAQAELEPMSRAMLEQRIHKTGGDGELYLRLARACVRDEKYLDALNHYDQAELLGNSEAAAERAVVGHLVGDFPDSDTRVA